jgi:hypothetical protein
MKELVGCLISIHTGDNEDFSKDARASARLELDGFVDDKHRGFQRIAASYDRDPTGTVRRNERQWSGVSIEEMATIRERLDLKEQLGAGTLGANICVEGIPEFSGLPKGSRLAFPSGAVLVVEEDNPPCADRRKDVSQVRDGPARRRGHRRHSGQPPGGRSRHRRGVRAAESLGARLSSRAPSASSAKRCAQ